MIRRLHPREAWAVLGAAMIGSCLGRPSSSAAEGLDAGAFHASDAEAGDASAADAGADATRPTVEPDAGPELVTEYELVTDPRLIAWVSPEAAENQELYEDEQDPLFREIFGADGLGYGIFAKAGIQYRHRRGLPGVPLSYNDFALHWSLVPRPAAPPEHREVIAAGPGLVSPCRATLRLSRDAAFVQSTPPLRGEPTLCAEQPFISIYAVRPDILPSAELTQAELLESVPSLGHIGRLLQPNGRLQPCELWRDFTVQGCSQQIIRAFEPYIHGFVAGSHDLYVELDLLGRGRFVYRLDKDTGDIEPWAAPARIFRPIR